MYKKALVTLAALLGATAILRLFVNHGRQES
jgi:hypothetical protein